MNTFDSCFFGQNSNAIGNEESNVNQGNVTKQQQQQLTPSRKETREYGVQVDLRQPIMKQPAPTPQYQYQPVQYAPLPLSLPPPPPLSTARNARAADENSEAFLRWITNGSNDMGHSTYHLFSTGGREQFF